MQRGRCCCAVRCSSFAALAVRVCHLFETSARASFISKAPKGNGIEATGSKNPRAC